MIQAFCVKCKEKGVVMNDPAMYQTKKVDIWQRDRVLLAILLFVVNPHFMVQF